MEHAWTLILFTLLVQAAAGMAFFSALYALCPQKNSTVQSAQLLIAVILAGSGTLLSLFHLSDPFVSYFAITNSANSWLSREILSVSALGILLLAALIFRKAWIVWLAALSGIVMLIVMSYVYIIPTVPLWHSPLTLANFVTSSLLIGAAMTFWVRALFIKANEDAAVLFISPLPMIIMALWVARILVLTLQMHYGAGQFDGCFMTSAVFLSAFGITVGFIAMMQRTLQQVVKNIGGTRCACGLPFALRASIVLALLWGGEICARIAFYDAFTMFGM